MSLQYEVHSSLGYVSGKLEIIHSRLRCNGSQEAKPNQKISHYSLINTSTHDHVSTVRKMRYVLYLHLVPIISLSTGCCSPSPQYPNLADAGVRQASISKYNTILFPSRPRRTGYQVYPTNGCPDRPLLVLFRLVIHVNVTLKPHSPPYLIDANEMLPITSNQNCGQEPSQDR